MTRIKDITVAHSRNSLCGLHIIISLHEDPGVRPILIPAARPRTFTSSTCTCRRGPMRCNLCTVNNCFTGKKRLPAKKWPQSPVLSKVCTLFTS